VVKALKRILVPVLCAGLLAPSLPIASASASPLPRYAVSPGHGVELAYYRGRHRHGVGPAGILGAIIAGTLIAAAISEHRARAEDIRRCDEDFPDFDPRTGTYINRYGQERVCPYLR
jgi:hypothetical protein